MRTSFFGYEKSKSALTAPAPLLMWGSRRGARSRAAVRAGGNGGAAAASGSGAADDLYGAGMGVTAPRGDFASYQVFSGKSDWTYNA